MQHLFASDCQEYAYPPEVVFPVLADLPGYRKWWPKGVNVKVLEEHPDHIQDKIEVRASGGWFRCQITSLEPNRRIGIEYYAGVVHGPSFWEISEVSPGKTKVCYTVDLELNGILPKLLGMMVNFSKIHSRQFKRVLTGLEEYLQKADEENVIDNRKD